MTKITDIKMREIEIFGVPALFTTEDVPPDMVPPGMNRYELLSPDGERLFGTVFTPVPVEMPDGDTRDVYDGDLVIDTEGEYITPEEFEAKYLSPDYGEERYGKD